MASGDSTAMSYDEPGQEPHPPVITLIGADLPDAYLDEAEPSPLMEDIANFFGRVGTFAKMVLVAVLVGGYPALMLASHKINTNPVILAQETPWASTESGTMLTLIGRELTGAGWAGDRSSWHPQARLTALPAWQDGMISALSDQSMLMATFAATEDGPDQDLQAAARLLVPSSDGRATPRLNAAAEALQRYDGRLSRGLAAQNAGPDFLMAEIDLYTDWFSGASSALSARVGKVEGWPAARNDIQTIYLTRARAHVATEMLNATLLADTDLVYSRDASEARDAAMVALRRVSDFNPVILSSQSGSNRFLSDHTATMAFYAEAASRAMAEFATAVRAQGEPDTDNDVSVAAATAQ